MSWNILIPLLFALSDYEMYDLFPSNNDTVPSPATQNSNLNKHMS